MRLARPLCLLLCVTLLCLTLLGCGDVSLLPRASDTVVAPGTPSVTPSSELFATHQPGESTGAWTVLVYLSGGELEAQHGMASEVLRLLLSVRLNADIQVVVQTGGCDAWQRQDIPGDVLTRYACQGGQLVQQQSLPLASMGEADTLASFLRWGTQTYPADRYMALLWDASGEPLNGLAADALYSGDRLTLSELKQAFNRTNQPFDLIGLDACMMATLETADALSDYGKYMVASQEAQPGAAWDYEALLRYLCDYPAANGEQVGSILCDDALDRAQALGMSGLTALSVTDLTKVPEVVAAFDALAQQMTATQTLQTLSTFQTVAQGTQATLAFGLDSDGISPSDWMDLGDLATQLQAVLPESSAQLQTALQSAVVYQRAGGFRDAATGLSVFSALHSDIEELDAYAQLATSEHYLRYLEVAASWNAPGWLQVAANQEGLFSGDCALDLAVQSGATGNYVLQIGGNLAAVRSVTCFLSFQREDGTQLLLGNVEGLESDWQTGRFALRAFPETWLTLGNALCCRTTLQSTATYRLYALPTLVNGTRTSLRVVRSLEDAPRQSDAPPSSTAAAVDFQIVGAYSSTTNIDSTDALPASRLETGDILAPLYPVFGAETIDMSLSLGDLTWLTDSPVLRRSSLPEGEYSLTFTVTDVFGQKYFSPACLFSLPLASADTVATETAQATQE